MFLHLSVILFTGGCASIHAGIPHPPGSTPPGKHTPSPGITPPSPGSTPPQEAHNPWEADPPGSTHIPWEAPPQGSTHPSSRETAAGADGTHPTGMHSCITIYFHLGYITYFPLFLFYQKQFAKPYIVQFPFMQFRLLKL